ncbi:hypothetical protein NPS01_16980 [Nocardioides psychrotolerans]|uniref:DUF1707 domain-containing protein n=1 Tax=Nocardioides psychrotolerans TaxID=1005945 RepID=A0A1I3IKC0_9ACTN|nr:DUF1707 domain-containing protein [Nocardioides psychrotolerans]GEP38035.1 hypothetical protein NPS01_16980 [Nocardioides psychrotolerans]SFI48223.1 protein of unknown function [Nocardioides psychrotolerans]
MSGELEPDPARMRVSDAQRHEVAEILREAAGDGRIDLGELDERLEATFAAKTYAELAPITSDLTPVVAPAPSAPAIRSPQPARSTERRVAIMSGFKRSGTWTVPEHLTVLCVMGGADLDLRQATYAADEVVITVNAIMGGASIVVGPHTRVILEGTGIMGDYSGPSGLVAAELDDTSPTVRVRGVAIWGGVSVERKHG